MSGDPRGIISQSPYDDFVKRHGTIQRRGIFGYFVHAMGRRIIGGEFAPGATLPNEPELVEQYGISRTVVREAMKCLAGKGLVEIKTRVGTKVRDRAEWHHTDTDVLVWYYEMGPSVEIMRSIKDLRLVLEPEAAARAASRGTDEDIAKIRRACETMAATVGDIHAHADADLQFHSAIFAATQNPIYSQLIGLIAVAIFANRILSPPEQVAEGQKRGLQTHQQLLDAIAARDPEAAAGVVRNLLDAWRLGGRI